MHKQVKVLLVGAVLFKVSIAILVLLSPQGVEGKAFLQEGFCSHKHPKHTVSECSWLQQEL